MIEFEDLKKTKYGNFPVSNQFAAFNAEVFLTDNIGLEYQYLWQHTDLFNNLSHFFEIYYTTEERSHFNICISETLESGDIKLHDLELCIIKIDDNAEEPSYNISSNDISDDTETNITISTPANSVMSCSDYLDMLDFYKLGMVFKQAVEDQKEKNVLIPFEEFKEIKSWEFKNEGYIFQLLLSEQDIRTCYSVIINANDYEHYLMSFFDLYQSCNDIDYTTICVTEDENEHGFKLYDLSISITKIKNAD